MKNKKEVFIWQNFEKRKNSEIVFGFRETLGKCKRN